MDTEFEGIEFENTAVRTQVTRFYTVEGAPPMTGPRMVDQGKQYAPRSVRFVFVDGDLLEVHVNGRPIKQNGEPSANVVTVPGVYRGDEASWPGWLVYLRKLAEHDFQVDHDHRDWMMRV